MLRDIKVEQQKKPGEPQSQLFNYFLFLSFLYKSESQQAVKSAICIGSYIVEEYK